MQELEKIDKKIQQLEQKKDELLENYYKKRLFEHGVR